jgi:hypothetical protein
MINAKAEQAFLQALLDAGLPVRGVVGNKPRYSRPLSVEEQDAAQIIIDAYIAGRFEYLNLRDYPKVSDQLDMLYWDMMAFFESIGYAGEKRWLDAITAIKDRYPKP